MDHAAGRYCSEGRTTSARFVCLAVLVVALLVLPTLGQRVIQAADEARFPLLARDMLERGVWFNAQVRGRVFHEKPPLYPWAIAVLAKVQGGLTETTAQIPVALAAVGTVWFTCLLGRQLFSARAGLWAGLVLATSIGFFVETQALLPDMLVACFMMAAGWLFWRAVSDPNASRALTGFYVALALAVFAKGPLGVLPLLVGGTWLWSEYGPAGVRRLWDRVGVAAFVLLTLVWLVPYVGYGPSSFTQDVLWEDWLKWYVGRPEVLKLASRVGDAALRFLPWTIVLPLVAMRAARERRHPGVRFVVLWVAIALLVVLSSNNFRTRYLLPLYPALALLVAYWADTFRAPGSRSAQVVAGFALVVGAVGLTAILSPSTFGAEDLAFLDGARGQVAPIAIGLLVIVAAIVWGLWAARNGLLVWGVVAGGVILLTSANWLHVEWANRDGDFRKLASAVERQARGTELRVFGGRFYALDFYVARPVLQLRTPEEFNDFVLEARHPVVLIDAPRGWVFVQKTAPSAVRVLDRIRVRGRDMLIVGIPQASTVLPRRDSREDHTTRL